MCDKNLPDFCPACGCNSPNWKSKKEEVTQEFKGKLIKFDANVTCCNRCGFKILTDEQVELIYIKTSSQC